MSPTHLPVIAITMGDPAGIGPEIVAKSITNPTIRSICKPLVVGNTDVMRHAANQINANLSVIKVSAAMGSPDTIEVLDPWGTDLSDLVIGRVDARAGDAAATAVIEAARLALDNKVDAIVTAPLNKAAMNAAGYHYAGHTELLAEITESPGARMLLVAPDLRVIHNSTHVSLQDAITRVTHTNVWHVITLLDETLRLMRIVDPRIAVCGLNPHAGEDGLFGDEDHQVIQPVVTKARDAGINATGPEPADTVFNRARDGAFDGVVAMYHDQGHIAVKVAGFFDGVNISVGLPIIRTSVDHGTAFDIAGRGIARADSMDLAIEIAATMANSRHHANNDHKLS